VRLSRRCRTPWDAAILQLLKIGVWIATKPPALGTKGKPAADRLPQLLPARAVARHEICEREPPEAGRDTGHQPDRPVQKPAQW
jgi:hypothetical protein